MENYRQFWSIQFEQKNQHFFMRSMCQCVCRQFANKIKQQVEQRLRLIAKMANIRKEIKRNFVHHLYFAFVAYFSSLSFLLTFGDIFEQFFFLLYHFCKPNLIKENRQSGIILSVTAETAIKCSHKPPK